MIVKNTLSITACNFSLIFKIMISAFILVLIFAAVFSAVLSPLIDEFGQALNVEMPTLGQTPPNGSATSPNFMDFIGGIGKAVVNFFAENKNALWFVFGIAILTIFLVRFFLGIIILPVGKYLANKMTLGYSDGLYRTFITVAGKAVVFSFFSTLIFVVLDVGMSMLIIYLCVLMAHSIGIFAAYIGMTAILLWLALRTALTAMWLPRVTLGGEKPLHALRQTLRDTKKTFQKTFTGALAIWIFVGLFVAATAIVTLGFSFVIIIPMGLILYITMTHVQYCHFYKQNYFKDEHTIIKVADEILEDAE